MRAKLFLALTMSATVFIISCKGKDGDVGPAGKNYDPYKRWTYQEGFVKGTATGQLLDGTAYSYNLDFEGNVATNSNFYTVLNSDSTNIQISKDYSGQGDTFVSAEINLNFNVSDLNALTIKATRISISFSKYLGNNKYHVFSTGDAVTISNLAYNSTTGIITGDFSVNIPGNTYSFGSLNIANGTFSSKLMESL